MKVFFIPGNVPSSKNGKRCVGAGVAIYSETTKKWLNNPLVQIAFSQQRQAFLDETEGLLFPLYIEFVFWRNNKHKFDYHNMVQILADQMKDRGWIPDDDADHFVPYFGGYGYSKENPGVAIRVLKNKPKHYDIQE